MADEGQPPPPAVGDPRDGIQPTDRAAALAAGPGKIPRQTVVLFLAGLLVLGVGGGVADHFFGGPAGSPTNTARQDNYPPALQTAPAARASRVGASQTPIAAQLPASPSALMGLQRLAGAAAPGFTLVDQYGATLSLRQLRGKVVVLTFFDSTCDDVCPVLATELSQAWAELGADASHVALVVVNTDPLALSPASAHPAEAAMVRSSGAAWYFATGSLDQLNQVWMAYGVSIEVSRGTGTLSHNDVLYFIGPSGRLQLRATPFANESRSGAYSLSAASEHEWAAGIAKEARALLGDRA